MMSKYTMTLREVSRIYGEDNVKSWFSNYNITDYLTQKQIDVINNAGLWTPEKLGNKIYNKYLMREIGLETPTLFKHYLKIELEALMEYYLPLIYTSSIDYDLLVNEDYTEEYSRNENNDINNTNTTNQNSSGLTINSNTPEGQINKEDILNGTYASSTNAGESTLKDTSTSTGTNNTKETYTRHVKGNRGINATYQAMIKQYRENIHAYDNEIIEKLGKLFMGLY